MKKLLALVLCVMMFVSVLPTSAFAATNIVEVDPDKPTAGAVEWNSTAVSKKAISNAKDNIERYYGTLAADNAVFGTIKSMDSVISDLAKGMFADVDSWTYKKEVLDTSKKKPVSSIVDVTVYNSTLVDNTKSLLREVIGSNVTNYMNKHIGDFTSVNSYKSTDAAGERVLHPTDYTTKDGVSILSDGKNFYVYDAANDQYKRSNGTYTLDQLTKKNAKSAFTTNVKTVYEQDYYKFDPIKYTNAFAAAVNDAFTSEKGAKGIEAYVYSLYAAKAAKEVSDKLDDLKIDILDWDGSDDKLGQYGFNYSWNPYAFVNPSNTPKATADISAILETDATSSTAAHTGDPWMVFIP